MKTRSIIPPRVGMATNRTIDDTYGDAATGLQVSYSGPWVLGTSQDGLMNGTFHQAGAADTTGSGTASFTFQFTGVAVYVYLVAAKIPIARANATITVDSGFVNIIDLNAPELAPPFYTILDFSASLKRGKHVVNVTLPYSDNNRSVAFDYAIYTDDTSSASVSALSLPDNTTPPMTPTFGSITSVPADVTSSMDIGNALPTIPTSSAGHQPVPSDHDSRHNHDAILGGIIGGIGGLAICLLAALLVILNPRRRRRQAANAGVIPPELSTSTGFVATQDSPLVQEKALHYSNFVMPESLDTSPADPVDNVDSSLIPTVDSDETMLKQQLQGAQPSHTDDTSLPAPPPSVSRGLLQNPDVGVASGDGLQELQAEIEVLRREIEVLRVMLEPPAYTPHQPLPLPSKPRQPSRRALE
ncbi:hypothetical protein EIP91_005318 [Steccherinum ochraceum]|uniref:Uncharacterized protein n=1 Tax=Steccherinum ochraceum TaxID=92696 RepID=A0A4V2MVR9_9APHY|nr:hypothetical protein EIP91_005318 [Steccherinum ochraceum]